MYILALLGMLVPGGPHAVAGPTRPDIVFILVDDLRWDGLSCMGHPYVRTPNIDRLREQGALMENAFVTTSICCPSRATFLTGTYASRHGVIDNETSEYNPDVTPPLTKHLRKAGYTTAMIGKWHFQNNGNTYTHAVTCPDDMMTALGLGAPEINTTQNKTRAYQSYDNGQRFSIETERDDLVTHPPKAVEKNKKNRR